MSVAETVRQAARSATRAGRRWAHAHARGDAFSRLALGAGMRDPYPLYRRLREEGPLVRSTTGVWVVPGLELADQVLRDRRFGVRPTPYERDDSAPLGYRPGAEEDFSLLTLDPPDHGRVRRLAAPAFRPKLVSGYRAGIERVTHSLLDEAARRTEFDLMRELAGPLPIAVISELLGIPEEHTGPFQEYGAAVASSLDGVRSPAHARRVERATRALDGLFATLLRERAHAPGEDVVSRLAVARGAGEIGPLEVLALCRVLLIAGFETTVNLIGNGVLALLNHPDQWALLCARPERAGRVVEEVLRYDSPVQATLRYAHQTVRLAGHRISAGEQVHVLVGSAGRDPSAFREPDRFDVAREPEREHLAFAAGPHYCLGAPLARLEGEVVFRALAERMPDLARAGEARYRALTGLRGLSALPVRRTRRAVPASRVAHGGR